MSFKSRVIPYKLLVPTMVGGMLEFYDLLIFGILAPTLSSLFFPTDSKLLSVLIGYLTFATGFFFRPLGSIFFGHIGDRFGRRTALYLCLILMSVATLMMGILPTYQSIGVLAPVLIILARILQGFSAGGEFAGGLTFIVEHSDSHHTGLTAGLVFLGFGMGTFFSSFVGFIFTLPGMPSWAWRIPFIIGFFIALAGLYIRCFLPETPDFIKAKEKGEIVAVPLLDGMRRFHRQIVFAILIYIFCGAIYYINVIAFPSLFSKSLFIPESLSRLSNSAKLLTLAVMVPVFGFYADKIGKALLAKVAVISLLLFTMVGIFLLYMKITPSLLGIFLYQIFGGILLSLEMGTVNIFLIEAFNKTVRYSCFAFSQGVGMAVAVTSPFFITLLIEYNSYFTLSSAVIVTGILALLSLYGVESLNRVK